MSVKFLHAADVHLDSPLRGLERFEDAPVEAIRGATRHALENLVKLAIDEEVAFVLLAGDLYDGDWKDYNTGLFFIQQMVKLKDADIPVYMISGNHDAASQISRVLRLPENVHHFSSKKAQTHVLGDLDVAIHGQSFASRAVTTDLSADYPQALPDHFNIGLLHTSLNGRPGHEPYAPCSLAGLRSKRYQYWALGHVHAREVVCEDPWIVFPGNIQGRHAREIGPKGCTLVRVVAKEVDSVEHRDLDVLRWSLCPVDLTGATTGGEVLDITSRVLEREMEQAPDRPLAVRLQLEGVCGVHQKLRAQPEHWTQQIRALASNVGGGELWVEKVLFRTERERDIKEALARGDGLGELLRAIGTLESGADGLEDLAGTFEDLKGSLPAELIAHQDVHDPTDPETLRDALQQAKDLLLSRLLTSEEKS